LSSSEARNPAHANALSGSSEFVQLGSQNGFDANPQTSAIQAANGAAFDNFDDLVATGRRFPTILADVPWRYQVRSAKGEGRSACRHYPTMELPAIKELPVGALATADCALFLWCLGWNLEPAHAVARAWGFEPKTIAFAWIKQNRCSPGLFWGLGYWTRSNLELCLLATKGRPKRLARDVHQIVLAPVGRHSAKPPEVHKRIERLIRGPYLELFARRRVTGWTVMGDEVEP
jgi:N6-adenosine-specific RNA methylase IME4